MPDHQFFPPERRPRRQPSRRARPTVLVTGASGVVGHALIPRLRDMDVVCLVHRAPVAQVGIRSVQGDLTQPRLGLSEAAYARLARQVDVVVHAAAVTDFNRSDGSLEATNIGGTEQVVALAEAAGARLYHVSTAFLHAEAEGERGRTAVRYAASKRAGEELVRASAVPHVILRPSVVIGDSTNGYVRSFQGLYLVASAILAGYVPLIPFDATWPIDFVPSDVVADAIVSAVQRELTTGEYWITAGEQALSVGQAVSVVVDFGRRIGTPVDPPRFVPPEMFDRLIGPVFLDALPRRIRFTVLKLLEFFTVYLAREDAMPSSLEQLGLTGAKALPDSAATMTASLDYWARATGRLPQAEPEVA
ncbi:MAG: SDR family oxidoreductase [Acidimicrobiales bacterium]